MRIKKVNVQEKQRENTLCWWKRVLTERGGNNKTGVNGFMLLKVAWWEIPKLLLMNYRGKREKGICSWSIWEKNKDDRGIGTF